MLKVGVVTASYGGYDTVHSFPTQIGDFAYEAKLVTDDKFLDLPGWETVYEPEEFRPPRRAAKFPKCLPHLYFTDEDGNASVDYTIWVDAHLEVRSPDFIKTLITDLGDAPLGQFPHTQHRTISAECALAEVTGKYQYDMRAQVQRYLQHGMPDDYGVWMTGLIVRRYGNPWTSSDWDLFGKAWLAEFDRWGVEDQISEPYILWQHDLKPKELEFEGWWDGRRFMLHRHVDGSG